VAGVVVGFALSAAFAGAAEASPLPPALAQTVSTIGTVPGTVATTTTGVVSPSTALPTKVSNTASAVLSTTKAAVPVATRPITTVVQHVTNPVVATVSAVVPASSLGSSVLGSSTGAHPSGTTPPLPINSFGTALGFPHVPTPAPGTPPLGGTPVRPHPSQIPPLAANDATVSSPQGQGSNPFGALLPGSLVLPALLFGAVLLAREKSPLFVYDLRYSPPG
jgi:hypothetical protein